MTTTNLHLQICMNQALKIKSNNVKLIDKNLLESICKVADVSIDEIKSKRRHKSIVPYRQFYGFLLRKHLPVKDNSLKNIGKNFTKQDHSTVIHSLKCISNILFCIDDESVNLQMNFNKIEQLFLNKLAHDTSEF